MSPASAERGMGEGNPGVQDLLGKVGRWTRGPGVAYGLWKEGRKAGGLGLTQCLIRFPPTL